MKADQLHIVIGSNSFLGRALCDQLVARGFEVKGVYHQNTDHLLEGIQQLPIAHLETLPRDAAVVYIVSAYVPQLEDKGVEQRLQAVNVDLVMRICDHFKQAKVVYCSTVSVYTSEGKIISESTPVNPQNLYGKSKLAGEEVVKEHPKFAIVRITSMFGPNMKETTFLPRIIKQALKGKQIVLFGDGSRMQNYIYVDVVAQYLIAAAFKKENGIFLAASEESLSNKQLAQTIQKALPHTQLEYQGEDNSPSYLYDNRLTRERLKITNSAVNLKDQLKTLIAWIAKKY